MKGCCTCVHSISCYWKDKYIEQIKEFESKIPISEQPNYAFIIDCKHYDRSPAKEELVRRRKHD